MNVLLYDETYVNVYCSQDELMYMLRKLLLNIGDLPAQTSHILFNYLVRP